MLDEHDIARANEASPGPGIGLANILVVGGYGSVGSLVCRQLAELSDLTITVSGRNLPKASMLAASIGGRAVRLDLDDPRTWDAASQGIDWVVMCMDQKDTSFVEFLFDHGVHYVDITASDSLLQSIERLSPTRSTALLSVGLAPGLTGMMAAFCADRLDRIESIEIGLLFGLGDAHGDAAIAWMADQLFGRQDDQTPEVMDFGFGQGRRTAHPVDFSDRHSLRRTLPVDIVTTRVAFESRLATWAIFGLSRLFSGSMLARGLAIALFKWLRTGSALCNASVRVSGWHEGEPATASAHFAGEVEARVTAGLAVLQIEQFLARPVVPGVRHSHRVLDGRSVLDSVASRRIGAVSIGPVRRRGGR